MDRSNNNSIVKEKKLSSNLIFDGKILHLHLDDVLLQNGNTSTREYCTHNGAVCVIPITSDGKVICVRQYRYAIDKFLLEIPAGKLDSVDEIPEDAAKRELKEETGATSAKLSFLGLYYGSPAILNEKIYMYLAEDLSFGDCDPDEDEFLEIIKIPLEELVEMVLRGEIEDGKTQSAVLRAYTMISKR